MTWAEFSGTDPGSAARAEVTLSAKAASKKTGRRTFFLTVRLDVPWLRRDALVSVKRGVGEHENMLRITPGGRFRIGGTCGRGGSVGCLRLPVTWLIPAGKHPATPVEFDYSDDWLEITLPAWARPAAVGTPPIPAPAAAPVPFRGAFSRLGPVTDGAKKSLPIPLDAKR